MSIGIRRNIAKKIAELIITTKSDSYNQQNRQNIYHLTNELYKWFELKKFPNCKKDDNSSRNNKIDDDYDMIELHFPVIKTSNILENFNVMLANKIVNTEYNNEFIKSVSICTDKSSVHTNKNSTDSTKVAFKLDENSFIKNVLHEHQNGNFKDLIKNNHNQMEHEKTICIDFSSPNIAKPFHVGHLRSTIIGNFISNLKQYLNNRVIKINYLGDWGTQFGLLQYGIEMGNITLLQIQLNPIESLYNAYVLANKLAKNDDKVSEKARKFFTKLETDISNDNDSDVNEDLKKWKMYRQYTIDELKMIYQRLNIEFDEYSWESQYNQLAIKNILNKLQEKNCLLNEIDGRKVIQINNKRIPITKSDGSTLYLTRDIAAFFDRFNKYKFDKMFYVVDNSQTDHFKTLFQIVKNCDENLCDRTEHIKFGRIKGMSTRSGNVVFLKDVLDEAKHIMMQKQIQSPTTKVDIINLDDRVADILGISAVFVNDLKQRRQRDYDFDWDKALQVNGDTGIKLQYTHCRLCSLIENVSVPPAIVAKPEFLKEQEAIQLVIEIAKFSEILFKTDDCLESCILVNYLFSLSNCISRALKLLNVKNETCKETQMQRMLLFQVSKNVLNDGMKILGLQPLTKM